MATKEELELKASKLGIDLSQASSINELAIMISKAKRMQIPREKVPNPKGSTSNPITADPYNADLMNHLMMFYSLPKPVDTEDYGYRIGSYFNYCATEKFRPTIEGLALCIGMTTQNLSRVEKGRQGSDEELRSIFKNAKQLIATFDAQALLDGKLNPIAYIFRAKNHYDMVDKKEISYTNDDPLGDKMSDEEIKGRLSTDVIIDAEFTE